jgi:hypothetical protein
MGALSEMKYTCNSTMGSSDNIQQYIKTTLFHKRKMWLLLFQKSLSFQTKIEAVCSCNY